MAGGGYNWKRVLFDTNMVSRWMDGDENFRAPLAALVNRLTKRNAALFVSAVTVQELMVYARASNAVAVAQTFLTQKFTVLPLDERVALEAARVGASHLPAKGAKQGQRDV